MAEQYLMDSNSMIFMVQYAKSFLGSQDVSIVDMGSQDNLQIPCVSFHIQIIGMFYYSSYIPHAIATTPVSAKGDIIFCSSRQEAR